MATLILNQKSGDKFAMVSPLIDPQRDEIGRLEDLDDELFNLTFEKTVPANVYETDDNYELELWAPGLDQNDIHVKVDEHNVLTVSAVAPELDIFDSSDYRRREFLPYGFNRSFQLPAEVIFEDINAEYLNGIIHLLLPKRLNEETGQTIEIFVD